MAWESLLTAIPSLITAFRGTQENPAEKYAQQMMRQQQSLAGELTALSRAQMDPNDPRYKKLYEAENQSGQQDLARVIAEAQGQNRMATRMGRTPLFDAGRGGETAFRALMQSYGGVQDKARQTARGQLKTGQDSLAQAYDSYGGIATQALGRLAPLQENRQMNNLSLDLMGQNFIGSSLAQALQSRNRPTQQNIQWNGGRIGGY